MQETIRILSRRGRPTARIEALLWCALYALESGRYGKHTVVDQAVKANVRVSADHLRHGSELLEKLIQGDGLLVVGAEYSLETGVVEFFDGVPAGALD